MKKFLIDVVQKGSSEPKLQNKTATPTTSQQTISPDSGFDGLSQVVINATPLQSKNATPTTVAQTIAPDNGYIGLDSVNIGAVTSAIDENIQAGNIKKDVIILGVTGTLETGGTSKLPQVADGTVTTLTEDDLAGATMIRYSAFYGCSTLTSVTIPNSVTTIENNAFTACYALTSITIPNGVTKIGDGAFRDCSALTSVTIPNSVTTIEGSAFSGCTSLASITLSNNLRYISSYVFFNCTSLARVTIPNGVTSIEAYAFQYCSTLTSVTIPDSVTWIARNAFQYCNSLGSITILATTPPTLNNSNAFDNTNNCPIYVPAESVTAYQTATNWASLASRIQAIPA